MAVPIIFIDSGSNNPLPAGIVAQIFLNNILVDSQVLNSFGSINSNVITGTNTYTLMLTGSSLAPTGSYNLYANGSVSYTIRTWNTTSASYISQYDIAAQYNGIIPPNTVIQRFIFPRQVLITSGNFATYGIAASNSTTFVIAKSGAPIGSIVFTNSGVIMTVSNTIFNPGDILTVTSPSSSDATLANISYTFLGQLL